MKLRTSIIIWLINLVLLGGSLGLTYLIREDSETAIKAHLDRFMVTRANSEFDKSQALLKTKELERAKIEATFITRATLINLIEEFEALARTSQVEISFSDPAIQASSLDLDIRVKGGFAGIYLFLERLENLPYQLKFNSINLTAGVDWSGSLGISLLSFTDNHVKN